MKVSSWQPDVGGQTEEEINWCQSSGGWVRPPRGPKSCLGVGGKRGGGKSDCREDFLTDS